MYLWRAGLLNLKEKGMTKRYIMNRYLVMFLKESRCGVALMKYRRKVKGEQVITLQIAQQLKTKIINVAPRKIFCSQCKVKF